MKLDDFAIVLEDVRQGRPIVIVDDSDRENEGDLMIAAEKTSAQSLAFMMQQGKGLICISLTEERAAELGIPKQVRQNTSPFGTNFGVSFDHSSVAAIGVSASARAKTITAVMDSHSKPGDFSFPGFVFPVCAVPGGVLKRRGQTEGSVDIARLAGLKPGGVICEIMAPGGQMLRGKALEEYCKFHNLRLTSVEAICQHRQKNEDSMRRVAESTVSVNLSSSAQTESLKVIVYVDDVDDKEQLVFIKGNIGDGTLVRIHSECLTGDVFHSMRCDCGYQLNRALELICAEGSGVLVYLHQEGRGIGLGNKLRAYALQDAGLDTVDANLKLGFAADARDFRSGAQILRDLGLKKVRLITNNPRKVRTLEEFGICVEERVVLPVIVDEHNRDYLCAKRTRLGHLIPEFEPVESSS